MPDVLLNKTEAARIGRKWRADAKHNKRGMVTATVKGQPHRLFKVTAKELREVSARSGRRKGVKVKIGKRYVRGFPPVEDREDVSPRDYFEVLNTQMLENVVRGREPTTEEGERLLNDARKGLQDALSAHRSHLQVIREHDTKSRNYNRVIERLRSAEEGLDVDTGDLEEELERLYAALAHLDGIKEILNANVHDAVRAFQNAVSRLSLHLDRS